MLTIDHRSTGTTRQLLKRVRRDERCTCPVERCLVDVALSVCVTNALLLTSDAQIYQHCAPSDYDDVSSHLTDKADISGRRRAQKGGIGKL